jgi:hypothetical protein
MERLKNNFGKEKPSKTEFFSLFALNNMEAMRLLKKFGLLRQEEESREHRAWGKLEGQERSFRNIAEHSLVVGVVADVILERLAERGFISPEDRKRGTKAALLHDLAKRQELERQYGVEKGESGEYLNPEERNKFISKLLEEYGVSEKDIADIDLSKLSGGGPFGVDIEKISLESPQFLIEWAISIADYSVAHTDVVSIPQRMEEAIKRGGYSDEFRWWFEKIYGEKALSDVQDPDEIAKAVYAKTSEVFNRVQTELKPKLGLDEDETVHDFIQKQLESRYAEERPEA